MIPPAYEADDYAAFQDRIGEATVKALGMASVKYQVHLSSIGDNVPGGTGPILVAKLFENFYTLNKAG